MTITNTTSRTTVYGDGTTGPFSTAIVATAEDQYLVRKVTSANVVTSLVLNVDYTVSAAFDTITLTSSLASGDRIVITRDVPITQGLDLVNNGKLDVNTVETALDKLTMIAQQLDDVSTQVIGLPVTSSLAGVSLPEPGAGEYLKWNSDGTNLETDTPSGVVGLENVLADESPVLGGDLDVNGYKITSASNGDITIQPNGTGAIKIGGNSTQPTPIRLYEDSDNGTNYVGLKAPSSLASSYTLTLPDAAPQAGQALIVDANGQLDYGSVGGRVLIGTVTAASSSTVSFTGLSSDYDYYELEIVSYKSSTNGQSITLRTSTNGGSSYDAGASDYRFCERAVGSNAAATNYGDDAHTGITIAGFAYVNSSYPTHVKIRFNKPSAADYFTCRWEGVCEGYNGATNRGFFFEGAGTRLTSADVDAIRIIPSAGVITTGQFKMYGVTIGA